MARKGLGRWRWFILSSILTVLLFTGQQVSAQQIADNFQYPITLYSIDGFRFADVVGCTAYTPPRHHLGDDIHADVGAPVKAVANGKVIFSGLIGGYGHRLERRLCQTRLRPAYDGYTNHLVQLFIHV